MDSFDGITQLIQVLRAVDEDRVRDGFLALLTCLRLVVGHDVDISSANLVTTIINNFNGNIEMVRTSTKNVESLIRRGRKKASILLD